MGHGEGYQYSHKFKGGHVDQDYLGVDKTYYTPTDRGYEAEIRNRLGQLTETAKQVQPKTSPSNEA
jgi:putative ATPase